MQLSIVIMKHVIECRTIALLMMSVGRSLRSLLTNAKR